MQNFIHFCREKIKQTVPRNVAIDLEDFWFGWYVVWRGPVVVVCSC